MNPPDFLSLFREEALEHLQKMDQGLLHLEGHPEDWEILQEVLRSAHTLKGSARMVGYETLGELAHALEELLSAFGKRETPLSPEALDLALTTVRWLGHLLNEAPSAQPPEIASLKTRLQEVTQQVTPFPSPVSQSTAPQDGEAQPTPSAKASLLENFNRPLLQFQSPLQMDRSSEHTIRISRHQVDRVLDLAGEVSYASLRGKNLTQKLEDLQNLVQRQQSLLKSLELQEDPQKLHTPEFASLKALHQQLENTLQHAYSAHRDLQEHLDQVLDDLEAVAMEMRLEPLQRLFNLFPRAVRDLAQASNKIVSFATEGGETRLDRALIEHLRDPLIHLLRNAVDHGIELPEERVEAGKPVEGRILIRAYQQGPRVFIEVEDDGRGLDPEQIRQKAMEKGLLNAQEASHLSEEEIYDLIFLPGFSTRDQVTEVSGRGYGMDIVRLHIEQIEGKVRVLSHKGQGCRIILDLPLTLTTAQVLFFQAGGYSFGLPSSAVESLVAFHPSLLKTLEGKPVLDWHGQALPLISMAHTLGLAPAEPETVVILLRSGNHVLGFTVEAVLDQETVILKSLGTLISGYRLTIAGVIRGDGQPVLVLSPNELLHRALHQPSAPLSSPQPVPQKEKQPPRILVVEDALTTRELERTILEAHGYLVETAKDGQEGLEKALSQPFDLIITDIQMPRLNGFELTQALKADPRTARIPVIILTSREDPEERLKGLELGASAYITKGAFDQQNFLTILQQLIG